MKYKIFGAVIFFIFLIDLIVKRIFVGWPGEYSFFNGLVSFKLFLNNGIGFGIPIGFGVFLAIFYILIFLFLIYLLVKAVKNKKWLEAVCWEAVILGAVSNLFDRVEYRAVVDYILFANWGFFNLADVLITVGVGVFILASWHDIKN